MCKENHYFCVRGQWYLPITATRPGELMMPVLFTAGVMFRILLLIGTGSFAGGVFRFLLSRLIQEHAASGFPWGTLAVNVVGCLAIGLLYGLFERGHLFSDELRLFCTVGLCGGFTTFSSLIWEGYAMASGRNFFHLAAYLLLSIVLGLLAVHVGHCALRRPAA